MCGSPIQMVSPMRCYSSLQHKCLAWCWPQSWAVPLGVTAALHREVRTAPQKEADCTKPPNKID